MESGTHAIISCLVRKVGGSLEAGGRVIESKKAAVRVDDFSRSPWKLCCDQVVFSCSEVTVLTGKGVLI